MVQNLRSTIYGLDFAMYNLCCRFYNLPCRWSKKDGLFKKFFVWIFGQDVRQRLLQAYSVTDFHQLQADFPLTIAILWNPFLLLTYPPDTRWISILRWRIFSRSELETQKSEKFKTHFKISKNLKKQTESSEVSVQIRENLLRFSVYIVQFTSNIKRPDSSSCGEILWPVNGQS